MKMSLCKVHLGRFQYCLDIPQLLKSGLAEAGVAHGQGAPVPGPPPQPRVRRTGGAGWVARDLQHPAASASPGSGGSP